jgi:hypothetical protein
MERRKFIVGLGSLAAGAGAAMSTGAFSVTANNRNATGTIVNDNQAYLALYPNGSEYSKIGDDGELEVTLAGNSEGASGLNGNSVTKLDDVFFIKNQGTGPVTVNINLSNFPSDVNIQAAPITTGSSADTGNDLLTTSDGDPQLNVGESWGVGVKVEITSSSGGGSPSASGTFTVIANEA